MAVDLVGGEQTKGPLGGMGRSAFQSGQSLSWGLLLCSLLPSRPEPAGAHLQEACLAGLEVGGAQSSGLHPHQAPRQGLVLSYSAWKLQGQGGANHS